jgi:hypothetical protein
MSASGSPCGTLPERQVSQTREDPGKPRLLMSAGELRPGGSRPSRESALRVALTARAVLPGTGHNSVVSEVQGHLLSVEDVGRELGLSVPQVWSLAASGGLRSVHGSWPPKFRRVDVESHASPGRRVRRSGPESPRKYVTLPAARQSSSVPDGVVPEVLSVEEAAALLGVSPTSLR